MWFGDVEHEDGADWVKRCMAMNAEWTRQTVDEDLIGLCKQRYEVLAWPDRMFRLGTNWEWESRSIDKFTLGLPKSVTQASTTLSDQLSNHCVLYYLA